METGRAVDLFVGGYGVENTRRNYRTVLAAWVEWCALRSLDPLTAERHHADAWTRQLERSARKPATIRHHIAVVSQWYSWLVDEGLVERNPFARIRRPPRVNESTTMALSGEQLQRLVDVAREVGTLEHLLVLMLATLGLRVGETCAAAIEDLGQDAGVRVLDLPTRKGGRHGIAVLPDIVMRAIEAHVGARQRGPLLLHAAETAKPVIEQQHLQTRTAYAIVRRLGRQAQIPGLHPHALRHTFATLALDAGAQIYDVQIAMGHTSTDTTMRYDRARTRLHRAPSLAVAAVVNQRGGTSRHTGAKDEARTRRSVRSSA